MAMQEEADLIIQSLELKEQAGLIPEKLPFRCFIGDSHGIEVSLITSGIDHRNQVDNIGCEAATLMASECVNRIKPELIISAGTAGGFAKLDAKIGMVYASKDHFVFHDRIVPLPGFRESGVGCFPAAKIDKLVKDLALQSGVISTGSSLEKNTKDSKIIKLHKVVAKEMEAAAIAWVAMLYDIPMFAIKSITNLVDLENQSEVEFIKHFDSAVVTLSETVSELIKYLANKSIQELEG